MQVITRGTPASYNDIFAADCLDKNGYPVRVIVHCRSLQHVMIWLDDMAVIKIS